MGKLLLAAGAAAIVLALTGCIEPTPHVTAPPTPSATPVFASDEEALAAAEEAYAAYLAVLDRALGTYDTGGLEDVAVGTALAEARDSVERFQADSQVLVGYSSISNASLVSLNEGVAAVSIYACLDVSGTDVVDSSGSSVVVPDRARVFPMQISLAWSVVDSHLLVDNAEVWSGENFCE